MTAIEFSRRQALLLGMGLALAPHAWALGRTGKPLLLSARDTVEGQHRAVGYHLDGEAMFELPTAQRCHDILVHPDRAHALFVARRPGTQCYWIDTRNGRVVNVLDARPLRHFYGHGQFDRAGERLYLTENDLAQPGRGVIGVYRLQDHRFVYEREIPTHGIEPHQLEWNPTHTGFVTANGGMITEANSREVQNPAAIESSLVQVSLDGRLISKDVLSDPFCSIRHVAVQPQGAVVTAQQYIGNLVEAGAGVPLLAVKPPGKPLQPLALSSLQFSRLQGYLASIAVHPSLPWFATTAPRGNRFLVFHQGTLACVADEYMPDCAGIVAWDKGFLLSSGQGQCRYVEPREEGVAVTVLPLPAGGWDNHLRLG